MASRRSASSEKTALVEALGQVGLFSGLPKKKLQMIAEMCRDHSYSPGDEIVAQGDHSGRFYLIRDGTAEVHVNGRLITILGPGQHFGEYSVIDQQPRTATVRAATDVRAYSLASFTLRPLLKEEPEITYRFLLNTVEHLRAAQGSLR